MTTVRRAGTASVAALSGLVLTIGLAQTAAPEWMRRSGLDVWNVFEAQDSLRATGHQRESLRLEAEQLQQEIEFADHVANRLEAGTISMAEATDIIEPILRNRSGFHNVAGLYYAAPTFRHAVARYLSARVLRRASLTSAGGWALLATRLEVEYALLK